jgi:trans-2,3-dihydro-3-hydroxyanthranilate isomerase
VAGRAAAGPTLAYQVVDVFTDSAFAGNPLAVVLDADDLSTAALQALAREFALSETAFPMASGPDDRAAGAHYRLRIFTPQVELPFAGHPSVGSAWVMAQLGRVAPGRVVQSCGAGLLPLEVAPHGGPVTLAGGAARAGGVVDLGPLLAAVGLRGKDSTGVEPRVCGAGLDFHYLMVTDTAVPRAVPDLARLRALGTAGLSVFSWDGERAHARVFAAGVGVAEDPATGSAALGLGVYLVRTGLLPDGGEYVVEQGVELGRPSLLRCSVEVAGGTVVRTCVSGQVVAVARGEVRRP